MLTWSNAPNKRIDVIIEEELVEGSNHVSKEEIENGLLRQERER